MKLDDIFDEQDKLTRKSLKTMEQFVKKMPIKISDSKNTQYKHKDVCGVLTTMSARRKCARASTQGMKKNAHGLKKMGYSVDPIPSSDWVIDKLAGMDPKKVLRWGNNSIASMGSKAVEMGMIKKNTTVALDLTLIPYYGNKLKDDMLKSKPKNGTSHFDAYMTAHSIGPDHDIPLSNTRMTKNDQTHEIMDETIKKIERTGLNPSLFALDKGYYSVKCINTLKKGGRTYVMPAVKNRRIKKAIIEVHNGKRDEVSEFEMGNSDGESASFILVVVKKNNYNESDPIVDQYVAFATNIRCKTSKELVETLPEIYRQRWIIETGFRVTKDVKGKTCSNKLHVRIFLFYFALLLYFLWRFTQYLDMLQNHLAGGYDFTIDLFIKSLKLILRELLMWGKDQGNFLEPDAGNGDQGK